MSYALIIDDDTTLLKDWVAVVQQRGYEAVTASTWENGLMLFQALSPNLVIADYQLPGSRHGLKLLAEVKRLRPSVRLILISAFLNEEDIENIMALGLVDRALTKGDSIGTTEVILDEIAQAASTADEDTNWVEFARAHVTAQKVSEEELNELDATLTRERLR